MVTKIDNLAKEINEYLATFADGVGEDIGKAAKKAASEGVKLLKAQSPELTGSYRTGWRVKKIDGGNGYTIHNATDYQITHLLENGHAKAGGGRVSAKVHIKPVEQIVIKDFMHEVEKAIYK